MALCQVNFFIFPLLLSLLPYRLLCCRRSLSPTTWFKKWPIASNCALSKVYCGFVSHFLLLSLWIRCLGALPLWLYNFVESAKWKDCQELQTLIFKLDVMIRFFLFINFFWTFRFSDITVVLFFDIMDSYSFLWLPLFPYIYSLLSLLLSTYCPVPFCLVWWCTFCSCLYMANSIEMAISTRSIGFRLDPYPYGRGFYIFPGCRVGHGHRFEILSEVRVGYGLHIQPTRPDQPLLLQVYPSIYITLTKP